MKRNTVLWIILDSIFLVIFNAMFFILGGAEHDLSVWLSYCFIHFAYFMLLLTPIIIRKGKSATVSSITIFSISSIYFIIALVTGVVFILIAPEGYRVTLLVQLCITGLYGVIFISNLLANERTADAGDKGQNEISFIKNAYARLMTVSDKVSNKEAKKSLQNVCDAVYSSPVKSDPSLAHLENRIMELITILEDEVTTGKEEKITILANSLLQLVNERSTQQKSLNTGY